MRMEAERERTTSLRGWVISQVAVGPQASSAFLLLTTDRRLFRSFGRPIEWRSDAWQTHPWELSAEYQLGTAEQHSPEKRLEEGILSGIGRVLAEQRIDWPLAE